MSDIHTRRVRCQRIYLSRLWTSSWTSDDIPESTYVWFDRDCNQVMGIAVLLPR